LISTDQEGNEVSRHELVTRSKSLGTALGLLALFLFPISFISASPTGYQVGAEFKTFYSQSGGLPVFGYAIDDTTVYDDRTVQFFERQRLELHPENAGTDYEVLLGHLGWHDSRTRGLLDHPAFQPQAPSESGDGTYFAETRQSLGSQFQEYWHSNGLEFGDEGVSFRESLALFGFPISSEFVDPDTGLLTQYYERARFEYHPEFAGTEYEVLLGHLGTAYLQGEHRSIQDTSGSGSSPGGAGTNGSSAPTRAPDITVHVDRSGPGTPSKLNLGVTHTQHSLDPWGDSDSRQRGLQLLTDIPGLYQNQHIMGWGATSPLPAPNEYDWTSLDRRIQLVRGTGGTPVITLCCAPDWMKGGEPGHTDWSRLEEAPSPEHYRDFAELSRQVALRYPDVKHFLVWNEMKGFYDAEKNRWDYESYTHFYNLVYQAVKSANPTAQVGGPYIVLDSWGDSERMSHPSDVSGAFGRLDQRPLDVIEYWLEHSVGADFVAVDAWAPNRDDVQLADLFSSLEKFTVATEWVAEQSNLPVWWAEWYAGGGDLDANHQNALMTAALAGMVASEVSVSLRWEPQGRHDSTAGYHEENVWTDTRVPGGGQPLPFYESMRLISEHFSEGTPIYVPRTSSNDLVAIASDVSVLLINTTDSQVVVDVSGALFTLERYEVRLIDGRA
jgi:hypothetical protein